MIETKKKNVGAPRTTVRLPEDTHQRAKEAAVRLKVSLQDFVAAAVESRLTEALRPQALGTKSKRA